jgi:acetyltransferase-like isoleucine patch superfamily enzyme
MLRCKFLKSSFIPREKISNIGFRKFGKNIKISEKCSIYNPENIILGNNIRIDDFCIISPGKVGFIELGNFIHIGPGSKLFGMGGIRMSDFSGLSSDVKIYSGTDDYSGKFMTNPTVSEYNSNLVNCTLKEVNIGKHTIIGTNTIILPGCNICGNCSIGGMSIINKNIDKSGIYAGIPFKFIKNVDNTRLILEKNFFNSNN